MAANLNPPQHMSAWMKYKYGRWIDNIPLIITSGTYTLSPVASSSSNNIFLINSWIENEYVNFLNEEDYISIFLFFVKVGDPSITYKKLDCAVMDIGGYGLFH